MLGLVVIVATSQMVIGAVNDICDYDLDLRYKPWRALPSGRVTRRQALGVAVLAFAVSFVTSMHFGPVAMIGSVAMTLVGLTYDVGLKSTPLSWLPVLIGFFGHGIWLLAMTGLLNARTAMLPLFMAPLIIGLHLANQIPDLREKEAGVHGLAHSLGPKAPGTALVLFALAPVVLSCSIVAEAASARYPFLFGVLLYLGFVWLWRHLQSRAGASARRAFVVIELGALILVSIWLSSMRVILSRH